MPAIPIAIAAGSSLAGALASKAGQKIAGNVGQVAGTAAQGAATGRETENQQLIDLLTARENAINQRARTDLEQRQFGLSAPLTKARQTGIGDLLANVQDVTVNRPKNVPTISFGGGLRPSVLGPNTRQAGSELSNQMLASLLAGEKFETPAFRDVTLKQPGTGEKILGGVGLGGSLLSAILGGLQKNTEHASLPTGFEYQDPYAVPYGGTNVLDVPPPAPLPSTPINPYKRY